MAAWMLTAEAETKESILFLGDSTIRALYEEVSGQTNIGNKTVYSGMYGCLEKKHVEVVKNERPSVVVWNLGLHLLHLHPARTCKTHHREVGMRHCGEYGDAVQKTAINLWKSAPNATLIWQTTNAVCEDKFVADYEQVIAKWHSNVTRGAMIKQCRKECATFRSKERNCEDELFDRESTRRQRDLSLRVLRTLPFAVKILDAFNITDDHCELTNFGDGRHYPYLISDVAQALLRIIQVNNTKI